MDRRIDDVRPAQKLEWEGAGELPLERSVTEPCRRCNGTGKWTYTEDAGDVGSEYKCQDCEPVRVQTVAAALPASDELMESLGDLRSDFYRYQEGDPKFPFSVIRQQIISMLELFDAVSTAPVPQVEQPSQPQEQSGRDSALRAEPAGQREAGNLVAQPLLYARLMEMSEIIRAGSCWNGNEQAFACKTESDVAMLDDILGDALRLAAEPPKTESSPIAEPDTATQAPIGYVPESDITRLADHRIAGRAMMVSKDPHEGSVAIYRASAATQAAKPLTDEQIEAIARESGVRIMVSPFTHPNGPTTAYQFKVSDGSLNKFARAIQSHLKGE